MAAAPRLKLADKQEIYKKVLSSLKKRYPSVSKLPDLPVLETMLFAVCLENATVKDADAAYKRLQSNFHDLNEVRVSSIEELEAVFQGMSTPDWRAMRIRGILGHVFESTYSFEFDGLKRKTLELATKQLSKIKELTPFVRDYTLHASLGAHVIPLDDALLHSVEFLDLQAEAGGLEATAESLKPLVRKADGSEFCGLMREFANDAKLRPTIEVIRQASLDGAVLPPALVRFEKLLKGEPIKFDPPPKKAPEKKVVEKKEAEKKELDKKEPEKKDKSSAKADAGKKPEPSKAETPKVEHAKSEASKTDQTKAKPVPVVAKPARIEHPAPEAAKPAGGKAPVGKTAPAKPDVKPDKKPEVAKADKSSKSTAVQSNAKPSKLDHAKADASKSQSRAVLKPEPPKGKTPVVITKKEPPATTKKAEATPPKGSAKVPTKNGVTPPKAATKPAGKPVIEQKSNKKPTTKSGK